jgi:hypothetical protein
MTWHECVGSINTEVHGGVPEVLAQFLSPGAVLLNAKGEVMTSLTGAPFQEALRTTVLTFLDVALQALTIGRQAFAKKMDYLHVIDMDVQALAPLQGEFEKAFVHVVTAFASTFVKEPKPVTALKLAIGTKLGLMVP